MDGYGLYSYLLYRTKPTGSDKDIAIFTEVLGHPFADTIRRISRDRLNLTSIPVLTVPDNDDAKSWISQYNLARSVEILTTQQVRGPGPFLVSCSHKLTGSPIRGWVSIDLSGADDGSAKQWVQHFVDESEQPDNWFSNGAVGLLLRINDAMGTIGHIIDILPDSKMLKVGGAEKGHKAP